MPDQVKIKEIAKETAQEVAAEVASEAVRVAQGVAETATRTAAEVARIAVETSKSVALFGTELSYIKEKVDKIEIRLENKFVTVDAFNATKVEVDSLKDSNKWLTRLVLGAVILAALGILFTHK